MQKIIEQLKIIATKIHGLETLADTALESDNENLFREKMQEKAEILADMLEISDTINSKSEIAVQAKQTLERFAHNANMALELESIFYMSALLYPENYKEGDPNDLDIFILNLEKLITETN